MKLFTRLRIGPLTVRNRVVFTAHLTNFAVDGVVGPRHVAYYAARAAGGAGLIITEEHTVHPGDQPGEKMIRGFDPSVVPGYRSLTEAVHAQGTPILAQLSHNGGQASGLYTRQPVLAPASVADPLFREVPKLIEPSEFASIVAGYGLTASHCVAGGFDGVEVQCAHSSLLRAYLALGEVSPLLEVVRVVRAAIGPDKVLGVRLPGDDRVLPGVRLAAAVEFARVLAGTGKVDYLSTAIGVAGPGQHLITPSMRVPAGYASYIPAAIRAAVDLPVLGVGRFTERSEAEAALQAGEADLIGVVRAQIADPAWASKPAAEIRHCLGCNQECVGRVGFNRSLACTVNPRAGHEADVLPLPGRRKRVVVVGGGPAGLQAAVTAAERGHDVTLLERSEELGGQVPVAASAPGRAGFARLTLDLAATAVRLGVRVELATCADAGSLTGRAPDAVILATGARPSRPSWAGAQPWIVDVRAVLERRVEPAGTVLVYDELGFHPATSVAELLAERGCAVEIATPAMIVGQDLGTTLDLEAWTVKMAALGVRQTVDIVVTGVRGSTVGLLHHPTGRTLRRTVDWVVCAVPSRPSDALWKELADAPFPVYRIGDCLSPRRATSAVVEGHRVAVAL